MSPAFPARRRADEFHRLVEARSSSSGTTSAGDLDQLVALAAELRELPAIEPRPEFSAALRERLMSAAATELTPPSTSRAAAPDAIAARLTVRSLSGSSVRSKRQRRLTAGVAALVIVGGTAGAAVASQGTLPGDTLYPIKRAVENVRTGFSLSDESKGTALLSEAGTRLDEVHRLTDSGRPADGNTVRATLQSFSSQATEASDLLIGHYKQSQDPSAITRLQHFTSQSIAQLSQIQTKTPADAQGAVGEAAQTLLLIGQAAHALCPSCGPEITNLPQNLLRAVSQALGETTSSLTSSLTGDLGSTSDHTATSGTGIHLPSVDPSKLPPATTGKGQGDAQGTASGTRSGGKTGGTSGSSLGSGVSGIAGQVGGLTGTLGGALDPDDQQSAGAGSGGSAGSGEASGGSGTSTGTTVGGTVGGVVGGVTGTVDGLLDGVGSLLGGTSTTP